MLENTEIDQNDSHYTEDDKIKLIYHFAWIRNLSRLMKSQITKGHQRTLICDRCLCHFKVGTSFQRHKLECENVNKCRVIMPGEEEQENTLRFRNYKNKEKVPFVVYADTECLLEPINDTNSTSKTKAYQKHVPYSIGYCIQCNFDDSISYIKVYNEKDCIEWFIDELKTLAK